MNLCENKKKEVNYIKIFPLFLQEINGSFRLQPQSCLTNPIPPIPVSITTGAAIHGTGAAGGTMCEYSQSGSEEIISLDDGGGVGLGSSAIGVGSSSGGGGDQISLSKKALHQQDADENLFLRFLELDPLPDEGKNGAAAAQRRQSASLSYKNSGGRTPFTISKKLARIGDRGFGFSIVWTHPPRVEKVESGLSAEKAGILPGDYIVFVDKHNVVTMPEADVLNLIKAQGSTLAVEIFRRPASTKTNGVKPRVLNLNSITSIQSSCNNSVPTSYQPQQQQIPNVVAAAASSAIPSQFQAPAPTVPATVQSTPHATPLHVSSMNATPLHHPTLLRQLPVTSTSTLAGEVEEKIATCSTNTSINTIEKRRLHLPQVTFSKEVGEGVIV